MIDETGARILVEILLLVVGFVAGFVLTVIRYENKIILYKNKIKVLEEKLALKTTIQDLVKFVFKDLFNSITDPYIESLLRSVGILEDKYEKSSRSRKGQKTEGPKP